MSQDLEDINKIEATQAPLIDHLIELRMRLIRSLLAFICMFLICFYFAKDLYNILVIPFEYAAGPDARLIYTAPQEFFFTQMKVAAFAAAFLSCPIVFSQIYAFVAPGLYRHERWVLLPYLIATPLLFSVGACIVFFVAGPRVLQFFISMQQVKEPGRATIELLPRVSEYLSFITTLIFAFGIIFQTPVFLTLLGRIGLVSSQFLKDQRRYAFFGIVVIAAILAPPDALSHLTVATIGALLYEMSILVLRMMKL